MVVDCGGGTVDITVHEMENESGNLRELYKAAGGPHGSTGPLSSLSVHGHPQAWAGGGTCPPPPLEML